MKLTKRDWCGILAVVALTGAMFAYRLWFVEPREWGTLCVAAERPFMCTPRAALVWLQHYGLWGLGALALGIAGVLWGRFVVCVAAVTLGAMAVLNYNATWGMLGAALGAWGWIRPPGAGAPGKMANFIPPSLRAGRKV